MADYKADSKGGDASIDRKQSGKDFGGDDEEVFYSDDKDGGYGDDSKGLDLPQVNVLEITLDPKGVAPVSSSFSLDIKFELDRDVVAGYWMVKFLVDSCHNRVINILGETAVEDYPDGESDMHFEAKSVSIEGVEASTLTNSGLLMAVFMANGEEVATVNMVSTIHPFHCT